MPSKKCRSRVLAAVALGVASFGTAVYPHHSFDADFNRDESVTIEGVVTEFWFANPHARIYLDVANDSGETEEWFAEGGSRNNLIRRGWLEDTITPGMRLVISGSRSRDGSNAVGWRSLTTTDGEVVGPNNQ
jgi:hypothetical protein